MRSKQKKQDHRKPAVLILAAGRGRRLMPLTRHTPKTLLYVGSRPILHRILGGLDGAGVKKVVIGVGHESSQVVAYCKENFPSIKFVFVKNPIYSKTNSIYTLYLARRHALPNGLVVINSDLVVRRNIISRIIKRGESLIAVERGRYRAESTKISLRGGHVSVISKKINRGEVDGCSIGLHRVSVKDVGVFVRHLKDVVENRKNTHGWPEEVINTAAREGVLRMRPMFVSGKDWCEVDTAADLKKAKSLVKSWGE